MSTESERKRLRRTTAKLLYERRSAPSQQEVVGVGKRMQENERERIEQEKKLEELKRQLQVSCWEIGEPALGERSQLSLEELEETLQEPSTDQTPAEAKELLRDSVEKLSSQEKREKAIPHEVYKPLFVVGVVEENDGELFLTVDRSGYDKQVLPNVPTRIETLPVGVAPDQIVVMRLEEIQGELQWVYQKTCGEVGDTRAEVEALAYRSGVEIEFSSETEREAEALRIRYEQEGTRAFMEKEGASFVDNHGKEKQGTFVKETHEYVHGETRLDLRDREDIDIFTIDPVDAKDFDDAISYREIPGPGGKKTYEVGVHIADVAHFARLGSAIEKDARLRQFTRYLKLMTIPMIPEFLSNELCSLKPGEDRLAFSTIFTFTEEGEVVDKWFGRSILNSKRRLSYEQADEELVNDTSERGERLRKLKSFTDKLRGNRKTRGAIAFDQRAEPKVTFDTTGKATGISLKERTTTSLLIEDLMLAANEAQAELLVDPLGGEKKLLLRAHPKPELERVLQLAERVLGWDPENEDNRELVEAQELYNEALSISDSEERAQALEALQSGDLIGKLINNLRKREKTAGLKFQNVIRQRIMSLLGSALYTTEREEHVSLAVEPYLHATSPIRRYPDLMIQHLLDEKLRRRRGVTTENEVALDFLDEVAVRANIARGQARRAEQDVLELAFLDVFEKENVKGATFSGKNAIVVGVRERGVRVAITLKGKYQHTVEIPWENVSNVKRNEDGRRMARVVIDGKEEWVDAFKVYGPSRSGYKSLSLTFRRIDRKNRKIIFSAQSQKGRISPRVTIRARGGRDTEEVTGTRVKGENNPTGNASAPLASEEERRRIEEVLWRGKPSK